MAIGNIHSALREATAQLHDQIDAQFGSFDLAETDGVARFLTAHFIAMRACQPHVSRFAREVLGSEAPDYAAMLTQDLAVLDIAAGALPQATLAPDLADAGIFYVVAGSRMGAAVLRQRATAAVPGGKAQDVCHYFAIDQGPAVWRAFRQWLGEQDNGAAPATTDLPAMRAAAVATFHLFAQAAGLADPAGAAH